MVLMDVKLANIYGFEDFHLNLSYPRRLANSTIENEFLLARPNFKYKKAIILMGANATGKTTLGKALKCIFNYMSNGNPEMLYDMIGNSNHPSHFTKSNRTEISESGKMEVLINILENILDANEKVLIFTQFVQMGKIIKKIVEEKFNEEVLFLHGSLSRKQRDEMIEKFQNNSQNKIFLLSLKAGGTGLNLTAASNVIHYDLWWNPAVENQATDRAYRIGQNENVMVYRFITTGTKEEKINEMIQDKKELAEITVGSGEKFITEMNDNELKEMLTLRKG